MPYPTCLAIFLASTLFPRTITEWFNPIINILGRTRCHFTRWNHNGRWWMPSPVMSFLQVECHSSQGDNEGPEMVQLSNSARVTNCPHSVEHTTRDTSARRWSFKQKSRKKDMQKEVLTQGPFTWNRCKTRWKMGQASTLFPFSLIRAKPLPYKNLRDLNKYKRKSK